MTETITLLRRGGPDWVFKWGSVFGRPEKGYTYETKEYVYWLRWQGQMSRFQLCRTRRDDDTYRWCFWPWVKAYGISLGLNGEVRFRDYRKTDGFLKGAGE